MLETLSYCPYCNSSNISKLLETKDYTVSRETFSIWQCAACNLLFTNPRPMQDEIGRYYQSEDYISHTNSKKGLINKVYQRARAIALAKKLKLVQSYLKSGNLLDIGCGTGEFLAYCKQHGFQCTGIEPDPGARQQALLNHGLQTFPREHLSSLQANSFNIITMWHVLEHVYDIKATINQLNSLLAPSGHAIIAVPNPQSFDAGNYKDFWAAYDVPRHIYHYRPGFLKKAFSDAGFTFLQSYPMSMDAYYVSMLSEKYQAGGVRAAVLLKAIVNGYRSNSKARSAEEYSSVIYVFRKG